MKSLSGRLGVILIGLVIFGYVEAWGTDWKYYGETFKGKLFYDADNITQPSKNIFRVWTKEVFTEKGVNYLVSKLGDKYKNSSNTTYLNEFDCGDKKMRILWITTYSKDGKVIISPETASKGKEVSISTMAQKVKWSPITSAGSNYETLFKILCR
jgi:hypothetical protein